SADPAMLSSPLLVPSADDVALHDAPSRGDPLVAEDRQIQGDVPAVHDALGDRPAHGRRALDPVPAEAVRQVETVDLWVGPKDGVVVERVHLVVAGPRAGPAQRIERWH